MSTTIDLCTAGSNDMPTNSWAGNAFWTDFLGIDGVVGTITNPSSGADTGSLAVTAQGTPNMTVALLTGQAYVTATPTSESERRVRLNLSASTNVTIASNSSGSTKYDLVYIKLPAATLADPPASRNWTESAVYLTERHDNSGEDLTDSTNTLLLAEIEVTDGATSITNDKISDKRLETAPRGSLITRGGTNSFDFTYTTEQISYQDIDLSDIVPEGAKTVLLQVGLTDNTNGSNFVVKSKDFTYPLCKNVYNNGNLEIMFECTLNDAREIQYKLIDEGGSAVSGATLIVSGWRF